ncbi:hypothetical protein, partial [Paenibacillus oryzae]|uniref:hypothetical protein n=1 Tax=Paenibacillus oryzae TaxID=1844972 RepID=UPI001470FE8F
DAAGVSAIVTFNSMSGSYDVALSKGTRTDSTSLRITFNEAPDPDIAIVQAAKEAVEKAEYPAANQAEYGTEAAVASYVEQLVKQAANNDEIGLSIHVDAYTAPKAGDADFPIGTDGQIAFTVTLTKGAQVQSIARQTLMIKAMPYAGVSNQQAIDKAMDLTGELQALDVPLGTTWTELDEMVKRYFNELFGDLQLDFMTISVSANANIEGQIPIDIYMEKGNAWGGGMVNLPLNEEFDPYLASVKTAIEQGDFSGITQVMYDNGLVNSFINSQVLIAIQKGGVESDPIRTGRVRELGYVPSITGDADNPNGTDGSYTFTITFLRPWQARTTAPMTVPILATAFDGLSNIQAVAAAKTALVDGTVNVAFGALQAVKTTAVQSYVNGLLVGDAAGVTAIVTYNSVSGNYDVVLSKGSANDIKSLMMTVNESADPDIDIVSAAKIAAEAASYSTLAQATATSESVIAAALKATAEAAVNNNAVSVTVNTDNYMAPIAGNGDNVNGTDGSYTFTVTVAKGLQRQTTSQQTIAITATPFSGLTNTQAVAAAKAALANGEINVAFGASQSNKTAAVQSYVNGLLIGDAAGVTAIVTYNSVSGNYDVAL